MTSRPNSLVHAKICILILLVMLCFPASGRTDEKPPTDVPPVSAVTATAAPQAPPSQPPAAAAEQTGSYMIKQGDTLWDIAGAQYRDPFLWPLIWKANPAIADPDLIYPGANLSVPSLAPVERAMAEPQEAPAAEEKTVQEQPAPAPAPAPASEDGSKSSFFKKATVQSSIPEPAEEEPTHKLVLPKETTPPLLDKYAMLGAGFISDEPSKDTVIGSVVDPTKTLLGYDDEVYINVRSRQDVKAGDRFLIYRPDHEVRHPVTNRRYGPLNDILGVLKVTNVGEKGTLTARITMSFDAASPGDRLTPYQEPELLYPSKEKKTKDLSGYVLETKDYRSINAQIDLVYLDKGKVDGIDPGDVFTIQTDNGSPTGVLRTIAEVLVFVVKERTATAIVRESSDTISRGDRFKFKN